MLNCFCNGSFSDLISEGMRGSEETPLLDLQTIRTFCSLVLSSADSGTLSRLFSPNRVYASLSPWDLCLFVH